MFKEYFCLLLLFLCFACSAKDQNNSKLSNHQKSPRAGTIAQNNHRVKNMNSLTLTISTSKLTVLEGSSIRIPLELKNNGLNDIHVHGPDSPSTFEYILKSDDGETIIVLSAESALVSRLGVRIPPLPSKYIVLAPGQHAQYEEDVMKLSLEAIPRGKYRLSVAYGEDEKRIESPAISLNIQSLNVNSLDSYANNAPAPHLSSIFTHIDKANNDTSVFLRESKTDNPQDGVNYLVHRFPAETLDGLSMAIETGNVHDFQWVAWLSNDVLFQQMNGRGKTYLSLDGISTQLSGSMLFPLGWQMNVSDDWNTTRSNVYFAVLGFDSSRNLTFSILKSDPDNGDISFHPVPLNISVQPKQWKVQAVFNETGPIEFHVVIESLDNKGQSKLDYFIVDPFKEVVKKQLNLAFNAGEIKALSMNPMIKSDVSILDILIDVAQQDSQMMFIRFSVKDEEANPIYSYRFTNLKDKKGNIAKQWTLPSIPFSRPLALSFLDNSIIAVELTENTQKTTVSENQSPPDFLNMERLNDQIWVIWFDKNAGFRYEKLLSNFPN